MLGERMAEFPLEPQLAKILLSSPEFGCSNEMLTIVAMLSIPSCLIRPKEFLQASSEAHAKFAHIDGDHLTLLNIYLAYKQNAMDQSWCHKNYLNHRHLKSADDIREQLRQSMQKYNLKIIGVDFTKKGYADFIKKCLITGNYMQVAHLQRSGNYMVVKDNQVVLIHPSSVIDYKPPFVIYQEIVLTTKNYIRGVTSVRGEWLLQMAPDYFRPNGIQNPETRRELEAIERDMVLLSKKPLISKKT